MTGYFDSHDPYTALPKPWIPDKPSASVAITDAMLRQDGRPLEGLRIAIVREHMVKPTRNHEAISDQIDNEIKTVLRDRLGADR